MTTGYEEFTGKTVEEALRHAREAFGVSSLDDLEFEILTSGSRGVLGMGAEPARIVAAPRSALGGAAPKRDAAASTPLPPPPAREPRPYDRDRGAPGDPGRDRGGYGAGRRGDRGHGGRPASPSGAATSSGAGRPPRREDRPPRRDDRGPRPPSRGTSDVNATEAAEVQAARGSLAAERADLEAAEASPEALAAGKEILEELMRHIGFAVSIEVETGDTSRLNVVADPDGHEALGSLIGRKGERLSALQHLVNLMLSRRMGEWTRVLVDVEDYRGRRERQLRDLANRAAARVEETGKMIQLEPMPALERRWIHLALRDHPAVATQSIGEEPNRRIVVLLRNA
jgi:predicted RNA-binding protein Jag